jgi:riboflavin kinase/FMN adenylyltransferase
VSATVSTPLGPLPAIGPSAIAMGVFDGVHLGHRALVDATRRAAERAGATGVALVFDPHPEEVVRPGSAVPRLAPPERNVEELRLAGVEPIPIRFDDRLRNMAPEEFLAALRPALVPRVVVMTPDAAFGRGRSGTPERVGAIGAELGFALELADALERDGAPISSRRSRDQLAAGHVAEASAMLGRPPEMTGTVVHGDGRGRELGFPTANLRFDYRPALPALGIYVGWSRSPARGVAAAQPALVSVGVRPTFHEAGRVLVEAHLLDWDGDLYGAQLRVELGSRLRDERRFDGADALVAQMRRDEAQARTWLAGRRDANGRKADDGERAGSLVDSAG